MSYRAFVRNSQGNTSAVQDEYTRTKEQHPELFDENGKFINTEDNGLTGNEFVDGITSLWNKWTGRGLTGAENEANKFSAEEAEKARNWEEEMSNTQYQRQVADMQAAGVNPALAMNAGSNGAGVPSSPSPSSVSPSAGGMSLGDLIAMMKLPRELAIMKAQKDNIDADTEVKYAERGNKDLEYSWNWDSYWDRIEAIRKKNDFTNEEIENARQIREQIKTNIKLLEEKTKTEEEERALVVLKQGYEKANTKVLLEMAEYDKALKEAETDTQKAQAALLTIEAAYQQKLIDAGYVESQVKALRAQAYQAYKAGKVSEQQYNNLLKVGDQLDHSLKISTGKVFPTDTGSWAADITGEVANTVIGTLSGFMQMFGQLFNGAGTAALSNVK